jgi:hypothetical protein
MDDGYWEAVGEEGSLGLRLRMPAIQRTNPNRSEVEGVLLFKGPEPRDALKRHEVQRQVREVSGREGYSVEHCEALIDELAGCKQGYNREEDEGKQGVAEAPVARTVSGVYPVRDPRADEAGRKGDAEGHHEELHGAYEAPEALASIKGRGLKIVYSDDGRVRQEGEGDVGEPVYSGSHSLFRSDVSYMKSVAG